MTSSLAAVGFINLYSATYDLARGGFSPLFLSQLLWFSIGVAIAFIVLLLDYRIFLRLAYPLHGIAIALLVLVLFFGKEVAGNRNWLVIGPFTMQPSEFAKITFIMALARTFAENPPYRGYRLPQLVVPGLLLLVPLGLIVLGRDIGSSLFLILTFASLILFAGLRRNVVVLALLFSLAGGIFVYQKILTPHQKARIEAFAEPEADPRGRGYHLIQSKITVGSGKIFGKGYLQGMQNKLRYLPESHTDFIFPVLAEEWGFLGSSVVLGLYVALIVFGVQMAAKAKERFGVFLSLGITALFFWQVVINLGGVLGLMPLTGVTLPFLSYGGSSLVTVLIGIGLLMNISMRRFMF